MTEQTRQDGLSARVSGQQVTDGGPEGCGDERAAGGREALRLADDIQPRPGWPIQQYPDELRELAEADDLAIHSPAHTAGPTVAEAAAQDRAYWASKYAGEER
jgi:hypothetical protein